MANTFLPGIKEKYPAQLLDGRVNIEANVIGAMLSDPLLLDDTNVDENAFVTYDGKLLYKSLKVLRANHIEKLDEVAVESYLNEKVRDRIAEIGGFAQIEHLKEIVDPENYNAYLDSLLKSNMLLHLYDDGFNMFDKIKTPFGEAAPIDLFREMDSEQVSDFYISRIEEMSGGYSTKVLEECNLDFDDAFLGEMEAGVASGMPFEYFPEDEIGGRMTCLSYLSKMMNGIGVGFNLIAGHSGTGKSTLISQILYSFLSDPDFKVMIISNEQRSRAFKMAFMNLVLVTHFDYWKLTKTKMTNGDFTDDDRKMLREAQAYWRANYANRVMFVALPSADTDLALKKARVAVLVHGVNTVVYDTLKISDADTRNQSSWLALIADSRKLETFARKYNICMICSVQLALASLGTLFLDASTLSGAKGIKETADSVILMRNVYGEEFDSGDAKHFCKPYRTEKSESGEWTDVPWLPESDKTYRMLFIDKSRSSGNVSSDNGVAYILRFDGAHSLFKDVAKAKPRHGRIDG